MAERPVTKLEDLPAFRILQVTNADDPELIGVFTHLKSVRFGRSWLYAGDADSLIGDLVDLDESSRQARFIAPFWSPTSPIHVGSVAPWLDGYWQAYHLTMILDPQAVWKRMEFMPSPAQHFRQGGVYGWTKAGSQLADDAIPTHIEEMGWDHEHCELCQSRIGRGGDAHVSVSATGAGTFQPTSFPAIAPRNDHHFPARAGHRLTRATCTGLPASTCSSSALKSAVAPASIVRSRLGASRLSAAPRRRFAVLTRPARPRWRAITGATPRLGRQPASMCRRFAMHQADYIPVP